MKIADIYIRVSTDDQADRGYSQRNQEEILRRYCGIHNIQIRKTIFEDHSAKSFDRPGWNGLLNDLKKTKGRHSDLILFTKWDRFSRNAGDAYQMISQLKAWGIEPQAIEQPLDISIPENKLMLAIYLAAPEAENDRRALNTFHGMRRAKKEGRWMSTAPIGYKNHISEGGKKSIILIEPQATLMKQAFETISQGVYSAQQVLNLSKKNGLKCVKTVFYRALRNPVYCGKIIVPKYKDEDMHLASGQHEPLISENLFYQVQDVINGRVNRFGTKVEVPDQLQLRGFLLCSKCNRVLTGSASKGRSGYYHYYHCSSKCGCRFKAPQVNELFLEGIQNLMVKPGIAELCKEVMNSIYEQRLQSKGDGRKEVLAQIEQSNQKRNKARELLLKGDLDGIDYRLIKADCEARINEMEAKLESLSGENTNIRAALDKVTLMLINLDNLYKNSDIVLQREIIGSIYPEKFTFEELQHRTAKLNEVIAFMCQISNELQPQKKRTNGEIFDMSAMVAPDLQISNHFLDHLQKLLRLCA